MVGLMDRVPAGKDVPDDINVVIEVPLGSPDKIEYDEHGDFFIVDRTLSTRMTYPGNYGFIPQTLGGDDDPLDCVVLGSHPVPVGIVVRARPVGVLITEDEGGEDLKILAVPVKDPRWNGVKDINDVAEHIRLEIAHFFEQYKALEPGKWVKVTGWKNAAYAKKKIKDAAKAYKKD